VFNGPIPKLVERLIQLASKRGWLLQRIGIEDYGNLKDRRETAESATRGKAFNKDTCDRKSP